MLRGAHRRLPAGEEDDPGYRGRHELARQRHGFLGDLFDARLLGTGLAGEHHAGLEQRALEQDVLAMHLVVQVIPGLGRGLAALFDGVVAVDQYLGLDDRHDVRFLTERGVAGQRVRIGLHAGGGGHALADRDDGPPLGEARAQLVVLGEPFAQAIQALRDLLFPKPGERLRAPVDLDPGHHALVRKDLRQRRAVARALADGLVEQDDTAEVALDFGRGEQKPAVRQAVLLGRFDVDFTETLRDRRPALVGGKQPLAGLDERVGDRDQLTGIHWRGPSRFIGLRCAAAGAW